MTHRFGSCCAAAVRAALAPHGYAVVEEPGWTALGVGPLDADAAVWHHDASAPGYSPGMPGYIQGEVRKGKAGANVSIVLTGAWHFLAAGVTFHAGRVLPGMPDNETSAGIETDHTTGETWSGVVMLDSMRIGTAALFEHWERDATALHFHKSICSPVGRKNDPDGLDLAVERRAVAAEQGRLIVTNATPATTSEDEEVLLLWA